MPRLRAGNVVVITGASSGIGRATALEFARHKTKLVLAARDEGELTEVARDCRGLGAECLIVPTDVTKFEQVEHLKDETLRTWGRIDVWVNNAGVAAIGSFYDVPIEDHRNVIETNVLGYFYGAHVALKVFKEQKTGTLINNASVDARLATPSMASYVSSKFAIRGLTHALRLDLALDRLDGSNGIVVCQINPGVTKTPVFDKADNFSGKGLKLAIPMVKPEKIAKAIVQLVDHPKREVFVGPFTGLGALAYTISPAITSKFIVWMMRYLFFKSAKN